MKIKRYMAESMRAALAQVRVEQGPDAVILSSRRLEEGIEVIAAVDYDEALFAGAAQKRTATAAAGAHDVQPALARVPDPICEALPGRRPMTLFDQMLASEEVFRLVIPKDDQQTSAGARPDDDSGTAAARRMAVPAPAPAPVPAAVSSLDDMQRELAGMREMLRHGFARPERNQDRLKDTLQARVFEQLTAMDIAPDVAAALAARTPQVAPSQDSSNLPVELLAAYLKVVDKLDLGNGGIIALVGATGVGKTTTIGKLATRWSMQHGSQDLALVSTDGYRIGARDQLMTYARLLGAPLHTANSGEELTGVLERLKTKKLILIDTAGLAPRDARLADQLAALKQGATQARVFLALAAHGEANATDEVVQSFAPLRPDACIVTKLDEAASLGAVLSTTLRHKLRIAYLCNGQRVPEDLHPAHERRLWLARTARKLKDRTPAHATARQPRMQEGARAHV